MHCTSLNNHFQIAKEENVLQLHFKMNDLLKYTLKETHYIKQNQGLCSRQWQSLEFDRH